MVDLCKEMISGGDKWSRTKSRCTFKAKTEAGYCKRHDPDTIKAKQDARDAKWRKKWDDRAHNNRIKDKESEALQVVKRIATGVEYPTETARDFLRELGAVINNRGSDDT